MGLNLHTALNSALHARLGHFLRAERGGVVWSSLGEMVATLARGRRNKARPPAPSVPTIVVGGLSIGGAGKTPVCAFLARAAAEQQGGRIAVVCRGWAGRTRSAREITQVHSWADGDEAAWLRRNVPHEARIFAGRSLVDAHRLASDWADIIIVDDGFQNPRLPRTADVVVVDFDEARSVVPSGPLREEFEALRWASLVWHHGRPCPGHVPTWLDPTNIVQSAYRISGVRRLSGEELTVDWLPGRRVRAVCGIARPERFVRLLDDAGAHVHAAFASGDHRNPSRRFLRGLDPSITTVITAKDAVRWPREYKAVVVDVEVDLLAGRQYLDSCLDRWVRS